MFKIFALLKDVGQMVQLANREAARYDIEAERILSQGKTPPPRWSFFLTNRSFLVPVLTMGFNILLVLGLGPWFSAFFSLVPGLDASTLAQLTTDQIVLITTLLAGGWSMLERVRGKTKVIWNRRQARAALDEANSVAQNDRLSAALDRAMSKNPTINRGK